VSKEEKSNYRAIDWLLEPSEPGVRYLALRDLVRADNKDLTVAKKAAHKEGPITAVLANMDPTGFWVKPGPGYYPKYTGTLWSMILLAQLGASLETDRRIATACNYILDHSLTIHGQFTESGTPAGTLDCVQGNLCFSLLDLGCADPRLDKAFEYMARSVTGEGIAPMTDRAAPLRYYAAKCGPVFACSATAGKPCAWGAVKIVLAFGKLPAAKRPPLINRAINAGIDFLFSVDPATADYPPGLPITSGKPNRNWWKFGFPSFYATDILEIAEAMARLGYRKDRRLGNTMKIILEKQDGQGRWPMEHSYAGKTWVDFGPRKQPNKWVTLRALRVLNMV
jgi:hypothetical protein